MRIYFLSNILYYHILILFERLKLHKNVYGVLFEIKIKRNVSKQSFSVLCLTKEKIIYYYIVYSIKYFCMDIRIDYPLTILS